MPLGTEIDLRPGDFVLDGDPALFPKRRRSPRFSAHVYGGQTAGWIKMPLGTKVGLGSYHTVLGHVGETLLFALWFLSIFYLPIYLFFLA